MSSKYISTHTGAEIDAAVDVVQNLINVIYPVGSIYTTI